MAGQVAIAGMGWTSFEREHPCTLDALGFRAASRALGDAGLRKGDVGLAIVACSDLYEARTISYGMSGPASGAYLVDEYRVENDFLVALASAIAAVRGNEVEVALVTGLHNPEIESRSEEEREAFYNQISSYTFEPHFNRPIGVTGSAILGMHAASLVRDGGYGAEEFARIAAHEIGCGSDGERSVRNGAVSAEAVLESGLVAWPLTELMLPAMSCGAVSVVLTTDARAGRCRGGARAWVKGYGMSTSKYTWDLGWLEDPAGPARRAARQAYAQAGVEEPGREIAVAELSTLSPALLPETVEALGFDGSFPRERVSPSGGVRSSFPGFANGGLRLIEAVLWLEANEGELGEADGPRKGLVHGTEHATGLASANSTVMILEVA